MARKTPTERRKRMEQALEAWKDLAHDRTFSGMSFDEFRVQMEQSAVAHACVQTLRHQLSHALSVRDEVDDRCMALVYRIGSAAIRTMAPIARCWRQWA